MKNIIYGIIGGLFGASFIICLFVMAVMRQTSYTMHGIVTEQIYEGWSEYNDYYLIEYEDGNIHEIIADDLNVGDEVVTWFHGEEAYRTQYLGHIGD